eukprot:TRINITY_DN6730_c0_g1_i1.p1 TRINITY_DN6730_c0_g1~~TRINITY_DN6730_c0_g1_i1.p1  ORF type:complete len:426 (+),score=67.28 TRINITY_DN6730_c0_g1_i1:92-1369(+)
MGDEESNSIVDILKVNETAPEQTTENMGSLLSNLVNNDDGANKSHQHVRTEDRGDRGDRGDRVDNLTPSPGPAGSSPPHYRLRESSSSSSYPSEEALPRSGKRKFEADAESIENDPAGKKKKCYRCGGFGHIQPECTSAQSAVEAPDAFVCYKCTGKGHFARNCPNLKKDVCFLCGAYGHHSLDCPTSHPPSHMRGPKGFMFSNPTNFMNKLGIGQMPSYGGSLGGSTGYMNVGPSSYGSNQPSYGSSQSSYGSYDPYGLTSVLPQQSGYDNSMHSSYGGMSGSSGYSNNPINHEGGGAGMRGAGGCYRCGEQGHIAKSCPYGSDQPFSCYRCGQAGHLARTCTNDPISDQPRPTEQCFRCGEYGHFIRDCTRNGALPNKQACFKCGQLGHQSRYCSGPDTRTCFYCKQPGHVAKDCKQQPLHTT